MRKAVFLDRDGTINYDAGNARNARQLKLIPRVASAIKKLNRLGYLTIIITNQPVIARGWITPEELETMHRHLQKKLLKGAGAKIDAIFYCPHHPEATLKKYRQKCLCRKPNKGMLTRAIRLFSIDPRKSFMVGDSTRDILAGKRAKLTTILVKTDSGGQDGLFTATPDYTVKNLHEAAALIAHER